MMRFVSEDFYIDGLKTFVLVESLGLFLRKRKRWV
jgi:hypothetical protein